MNAKEIIRKLRMTFAELTGTATSTLQDGTEVEITELAVGGIVTIAGTPAPAGEHTLSDGTVIVLGEDGVIIEITSSAEAEPTSLGVATLQDGTEVEITELAVGGIVTIAGTPAPAGEHILSDGSMIVLGENGVIMEIKPPAAAAPVAPPVADDMNARFSAFESATNKKFAAYESKFAAYEAKLAKANQVIKGLLNLTQTLAETPTGTPDASVKTTNSFQDEPKKKSLDILFS